VEEVESDHDWYEFTPFEIGNDEHGGKTTFFFSNKKF
jgi:hypothetical protein